MKKKKQIEWVKLMQAITCTLGETNISNIQEYRVEPILHERPYKSQAEFLKTHELGELFHRSKAMEDICGVRI